jgi:N-methylhydantoinase A/oxoprolinase/acetone carboxylase beta subunit
MANAVRAVTTERGLDPRDFGLVAAGGAGPMHVIDVAAEPGMTRVVVPHAPGTFSALGMLSADLRRDYVQTLRARLDDLVGEALQHMEDLFDEMEQTGRREVTATAGMVGEGEITIERSADLRYVGQEHTVTVTVPIRPDRGRCARQAEDRLRRVSHHAPDQSVPRCEIASRFRDRWWSKSKSSNDLRAGNRAARMRPSPPWASRAATSRCRQAARNSSCVQPSDRARSARRSTAPASEGAFSARVR